VEVIKRNRFDEEKMEEAHRCKTAREGLFCRTPEISEDFAPDRASVGNFRRSPSKFLLHIYVPHKSRLDNPNRTHRKS
jgi:hypothetical protein